MSIRSPHARAAAAALLAATSLLAASCSDATRPEASPVVALDLSAVPTSVGLGDTVAVNARTLDGGGQRLADHPPTLASSNPAVLAVLASGSVVGQSAGVAYLRASSDGASGRITDSVAVTVARLVRSVTAAARVDTLLPDDTVTVVAQAFDRAHAAFAAPIRFASSDGSILAVDSVTGVVRALSDGGATITARSGAATATVALRGTLPRLALPGAATAITLSPFHGCALVTGGAAYCWGANGSGNLGDGTTVPHLQPAAVVGGLRFASIDADRRGACGLTTSSLVYCWGEGSINRVPFSVVLSPSLVPLADSGATAVAVRAHGDGGGCALDAAGAAWCWGSNAYGQLGSTDSTNANQTVRGFRRVVGTTRFLDYKAGFGQGCGMSLDHHLYCVGAVSEAGLLQSPVTSTTLVPGAGTIAQFTLGWEMTCVLDAAGTASCAGYNYWGEMGHATPGPHPSLSTTFTPVSGNLRFTAIKAQFYNACGLDASGQLWCWGMLGRPVASSTNATSTPTLFSRTHRFVDFAVGSETACGLTSAGEVYCGRALLAGTPPPFR